jgi:hypothetical protein
VKFLFWHNAELPPKPISISLKICDEWYDPNDVSKPWTYCPLNEGRYAACNLIPREALEGRMGYVFQGYYRTLEKCGRRNDKIPTEWFRDYFRIKEYPQLQHRLASQNMSDELCYIMNYKPQYLLGVLEASWYQYDKCDRWDVCLKSTKVPVLGSDMQKRLDTTFLPLPRLKAIATRLELEGDMGFLKELGDITDTTVSKWSFLKRFGVGVEEDMLFWVTLLRKAREKVDISVNAVFEIYTQLQKLRSTPEDSKCLE